QERPGELPGRVHRTRPRTGIDLVPAPVSVLKREQGACLALDLARERRLVEEPPGIQPVNPVLQRFDAFVGCALAQNSRDASRRAGEIFPTGSVRQPAQDLPVAPGESELAIEWHDAIKLVWRQLCPGTPRPFQKWPEPLDGGCALPGDL